MNNFFKDLDNIVEDGMFGWNEMKQSEFILEHMNFIEDPHDYHLPYYRYEKGHVHVTLYEDNVLWYDDGLMEREISFDTFKSLVEVMDGIYK